MWLMDITGRLYPQAGDDPGCNVLGQFLPATNLLVGIATITLTVIQRLRLYIEKIMLLHLVWCSTTTTTFTL